MTDFFASLGWESKATPEHESGLFFEHTSGMQADFPLGTDDEQIAYEFGRIDEARMVFERLRGMAS